MEKRLILALSLSFLVLVLWPALFPPPDTARNAPVPAAGPAEPTSLGATPTGEPVPFAPLPGAAAGEPWRETLVLGKKGERGHYQATFDSLGGTLAELRLDGYWLRPNLSPQERDDPANWVPLVEEVEGHDARFRSLALGTFPSSAALVGGPLEAVHWEHEVLEEGGAVQGVRFRHAPGTGVVFSKTLRSVPGRYGLALELEVANESFTGGGEARPGRSVRFVLTPAMGVPNSADDQYYPEPRAAVCVGPANDPLVKRVAREFGSAKVATFPTAEGTRWAGVDNKYFAVLLRPIDSALSAVQEARWRTVYDAAWVRAHPDVGAKKGFRHITSDVDLAFPLPPVGESQVLGFELYAGPKQRDVLREHEPSFEELAIDDLGYFQRIGRLMLAILGFFHGMVGNWGVSIILLTLLVRTVLFPFNRKSQTALARHATKMKRVQPKIEAVKEKYAKDPRKLREEQARIMQEEGALPPLGGCLPPLVQIPVFFGLFSALRASFELRQAPFLYVTDLSQPDRFLALDLSLPLIGKIEYLNILPPVMVVLWILQQRVMPKPTDPQALRMQKMMMWMPILFGVFLYNYPAGLSVYMITTSLFGILELTVIKRIWPIDDKEQPKSKKGFMARMAELSEQARKMEKMKREEQDRRRKHKKNDRPQPPRRR